MVSGNNIQHKLKMDAKRVPRFGIRKLSVGIASVLLGTTFYFGANGTVHADTVNVDNAANLVDETDNNVKPTFQATNLSSGQQVSVQVNSNKQVGVTANAAPVSQASG